MALTDPAIIVETIAIEAPIDKVYAALTVPEQLMQWWGSEDSYRCTTVEADLRAGGAWRTRGIGRDGKPFTVYGTYLAVDPPRLVEFTWRHDWGSDEDDSETVVRYELAERSGVTDLTVTHTGFATAADREGHAEGWKTVLRWVNAYVTARGASA